MNFLLVHLCRFTVRAPSHIFSSFSRQRELVNFITKFHSPSALPLTTSVLHYLPPPRLRRAFPSARSDYPPVSLLHLIVLGGIGISTDCPSSTPFGLDLGPDLPWADEPSPGNLRLSTEWFLATLSLLMPAFSLVSRPLLLSLQLLPIIHCSSTDTHSRIPKLRCQVLAPVIFGAPSLDQ